MFLGGYFLARLHPLGLAVAMALLSCLRDVNEPQHLKLSEVEGRVVALVGGVTIATCHVVELRDLEPLNFGL